MRLMHHLFFNSKYRTLFYFLPLFLTISFIYLFYSFSQINEYQNIKKVNIIKKEKKLRLFDFIYDLEEEIKHKKLDVKNIKITPKKVFLQIEDDFLKSIAVIDFIEKYSSKITINKLSFKTLGNNKINLYIEIELNNKDIFYKKSIPQEIKNIVLYQKNTINSKETFIINDIKEDIKIDAIINSTVLVNNKWYKIGEKVNGEKIISIKSDFIVIEKNNHKTKVWIYQNEYTR
ncbi:hypothetical protein [Arcobacter sp. F2176]|uniref:hypothetical protein n=1 Tax=Arcobacter sp. F2176 TaxID=2044511 RepID=UPI00100B55BA|nr:hypothetical protein [Arcobacter sp. F2176]RXJ79466.1 hypothetical protein CRU95_14075 [Arcobacter sp. F2176]